jgi:putative ABC transport system ATP-binding protein
MELIKLTDLIKIYKQGTKTIHAVDGINLTINRGDFAVIIGASGSGKSTLLALLGGLEKPTSGEINISGINFSKTSEAKLTKIRQKKIGFIFQSFNLIPTLTASQNVEAAIAKRSQSDPEKSKKMLEKVGLGARANHLPSLLSGGEQQRVAIARALINEPELILADEPTGNLDSKTGTEIIELLHGLNKKNNQTIVLITHNDYVKKYSSKTYEIKDGKIVNKS